MPKSPIVTGSIRFSSALTCSTNSRRTFAVITAVSAAEALLACRRSVVSSAAAAAVRQWSADRGAAARMQRRRHTARAPDAALGASCSAAVGCSAARATTTR